RELLARAHAAGARAWIVLERPRETDRASMAVVAEAMQASAAEAVLWLIADTHEPLPPALLRLGEHDEIAIEPLAFEERAQMAEAALALPPGSEIARRIARLGGDSALGVWA